MPIRLINRVVSTIVVFDIVQQWVADLVEVQTLAKQNKGFRYILVAIDAFYKCAWAQPIKKETGKDVAEAFVKILKSAQGRKPQTLQTILQSSLSDSDETAEHSSFFHPRKCQSQYCRTI